MAKKSWTFIDVSNGTYVKEQEIGAKDVGGNASGYSITKSRLSGGLQDGVDVVSLNNGKLKLDVLPSRGMGLWKAWYDGVEFGWKSPVRGPVHPKFVDMGEPSGLGWLDGFDELLVRCGLESNGAPEFDENNQLKYPLHGRIGNRPAHTLEAAADGDNGEISATGVVDEARFHFHKLQLKSSVVTKVGERGFRIIDEIKNLSASPAEAQMLYHMNFGVPILDAGAQVVAPYARLVPRNDHAASGIDKWNSYEAAQAGFEEQVYFFSLMADANGQTQVLLKNAHGTQGVSMFYNVRQLPCFTVWKNTTAVEDGCVTGLEPGTNYPNPRTFEGEKKRVAKLDPLGSVKYELRVEFHTEAAQVEAAEAGIKKLIGGRKQRIDRTPQSDWCHQP